jgi:hypothetical protein
MRTRAPPNSPPCLDSPWPVMMSVNTTPPPSVWMTGEVRRHEPRHHRTTSAQR